MDFQVALIRYNRVYKQLMIGVNINQKYPRIEVYSWILSGCIIPMLKTITVLQHKNPCLDISLMLGPYFISKFQKLYPQVKMEAIDDGYDEQLYNKVMKLDGAQGQQYVCAYLKSHFEKKTNLPDLIIGEYFQLQAFRFANKHNIKFIVTVPNAYQEVYHFLNFPSIERSISIEGYTVQYQRKKHSIENIIRLMHEEFRGKALFLIESFIGLDYATVVPTNHKFIGLLANYAHNHCQIDADLAEWMQMWKQKGKNQFLYISFGSMITFSETLTQTIYRACIKLDLPVIWSLKSPISSSIKSDLIFQRDWLPQETILSLPEVSVFLTHCGWSSIGQAIFSETPMVCVPIFYDQKGNSELIVKGKLGVKIYQPTLHDNPFYLQISLKEEDVVDGIKTVINDKTYLDGIKRMHRLSLTYDTPDLLNRIILETLEFGYEHLINQTYENMTMRKESVGLKEIIT